MTTFNTLNVRGHLLAGVDQLIERYEVTDSAVQSKSFSNLLGDSDLMYYVKTRIISGVSGSNRFFVRPNGVSDPSVYGQQVVGGTNGTVFAWRSTNDADNAGLHIGRCNTINTLSQGECTLYPKSGVVRSAILCFAQEISGTSVSAFIEFGAAWFNINDEITSIVVASDQVGGIGIGSEIELWVRRRTA